MRKVLVVFSLFCLTRIYGQTHSIGNPVITDTCFKIYAESKVNEVGGTKHFYPLFVANEIVVRSQHVDTSLVESIGLLKCPEAFYRFGYAGVNGAVVIKTKQVFETVTPGSIRNKMSMENEVLYALNDYILADSSLKISIDAIRKIDILRYKGSIGLSPRPTIIGVWTLKKKERTVRSLNMGLCRGVEKPSVSLNLVQ